MANFLFPYLIQRLCDEASIPKISRVDERLLMTATMQTKSMKDLACLGIPRRSNEPAAAPQAQTEGLSVSTELGDAHGGNVGICVDIEIRDQREAPYISN